MTLRIPRFGVDLMDENIAAVTLFDDRVGRPSIPADDDRAVRRLKSIAKRVLAPLAMIHDKGGGGHVVVFVDGGRRNPV